jgi:RecB family exonuclease
VLDSLRRGLAAAGVPVARAMRGALTDEPLIARLVGLLRCVARPDTVTAELAEDLLTGVGGADPLQMTRIQRYLRRMPGGPVTLADLIREPAVAAFLPVSLRAPVERVRAIIDAGAADLDVTSSAEDVLWQVWQATGLAERLERRSLARGADGARADRDLDAVLALFAEAAKVSDRTPGGGVQQLYEWVDQLQITDSATRRTSQVSESVAIVTAHASKGLEWDVVCLAGVQEGVWPNLRQRGSLLGADLLVDLVAQRPAVASGQLAERLNEERRLFYVAATRARRKLYVTAIATDDSQPSAFLDELDPSEIARPVIAAQRRFVLPGMVAELRAALLDPACADSDRAAAADGLARLARAGVQGADPDDWWGLADPSTSEPIRNPKDGPVPIRPSRFEAYLDCELKALLTELGAVDASDQVAASLGTLIHSVAEQAPDDAPIEKLRELLDEGWDRLQFNAPWQRAGERQRAEEMLAKLGRWLSDSRAELSVLGRETAFSVVVGDAELAGKVDRLERDRDGRLVVIDFKTGKSKPTNEKVLEHPQLAAYQLAVEAGGFTQQATDAPPSESGGARLVQLGAGAGAVQQNQPPLRSAEDPDWVRDELARIAAVLRGNSVSARVGTACSNCKVKLNCPAQLEGRSVTQ